MRATPLQGKSEGAVVAHINVTERVEAARKQRVLSEAAEQAGEAILITEGEPSENGAPQGGASGGSSPRVDSTSGLGRQVLYVNSAAEEMTGYSEEELLGKSPQILRGPETDPEMVASLRQSLSAEEPWQGEMINYRKDQAQYVALWSVAPVFDEMGEVQWWVSVQRDVTTRRKREEALQRQRNLLDQAQRLAGAWTADVQTGEVSWSDKVYEIFEVPMGEEITTQQVFDLHAPKGRKQLQEVFERAVEEGESYDVELPIRTENGNRGWVRGVGAAVDTEEGEVTKVAGAVQDITDRKEAEKALRERETRLRGIANSIPGIVYQFYVRPEGEDGCYFISDRAESILGMKPDPDCFHERFVEGIPPSHRRDFLDAIDEAATDLSQFRFEMPFETPDGERLWLLDVSIPEKRGEEIVFNGVLLDATERKEAERERERLADAMDVASDGMAILNEEGVYTYMNQAHAEIYGYDCLNAFLGNTWRMCYSSPEIERLETEIMPVLWEEGSWTGEIPGTRKDGTQFPQTITLTRLGDGGIICVARDITEWRKQERRRAQIVERVTDAIVEVDSDWRFTLANDRAEDLYEMEEDELLGRDFWDVFVETIGTRFEEEYRGVMESREPTRFEAYYPGLEGWFDIQVYPNEDGGIAFYFEEVTERRRRQKERARQNDLFSKAQSLAWVGAWEHDLRTGTSIWTDELYRIYGLAPDTEPSPEQGFALYREEDRKKVQEAFQCAIEQGEPYDLEARLTCPDGAERWIRTKAEPQIDEEGKTVRLRGAIRDITEQKRHEKRLQRTTSLLQLTEELTDVGGCTVDTAGDRPYRAQWTENLYEIFGLPTEEEPPTEKVFEYYHPDDRERHKEAVLRAGQDRESWDQELRLIREDGETRWVHNVGRPVVEDGEVVQIQGAIQDITGRKEREEELQETKHLLEKTLESLSEAVVVVDPPDREVIMCNSAVKEIFGYDPEELVGKSTEVLHMSRDAYERFASLGEPHLEDEGRFTTEYQMCRKDGTIIDTENVVTPLKGDDRPSGVVSVIRDITGRKDRERELKEAKEEAERMNRLKSAFLANMSHEIRTPLTSILGFAEIIGEEIETLKDRDEDLELSALSRYSGLIQKGGYRLMDMLEDTLNLSKLEAGEMDLSAEKVNLAVVVTEVAEQFEVQAEQAGVNLEVQVVGDEIEAWVDPDGLKIALRNLVSNALKYTESGGEVYVRAHRSGETFVLEVEDTGIGMDPERVPELFQAFAQESQGMSRKYEGSGLGLTLTKRVVDQMGGDIQVETQKGEGSCFTVRLPGASGDERT